jgi:hypothetical protein
MDYLASPYTHDDERVMQIRYEKALDVVVSRVKKRIFILSPIVYCHLMAVKYGLPRDAEFWEWLNVSMMLKSSNMQVLKLDGWKESGGLANEIKLAVASGMPITYMTYEEAMT